jgi:hypothetical protein
MVFYPGKSKDGITLSDLVANFQNWMDTWQFFKGHAKFKNVYNARNQASLHDCLHWHVYEHGLKSLVAPTCLEAHDKMDIQDKVFGMLHGLVHYQLGKSYQKNSIVI